MHAMASDGGRRGAVPRSAVGAIDPDQLVAELFDREARSLVRLARIFCDDQSAAEDLVQESFIRLHRSADKIRDVDRAPAFLRSIVINLARDHNRRGLMSLRHHRTMAVSGPVRSAEDDSVDADGSAAMLDAVRQLPDRQRACLVLRYYLDLSERDIAETLHISPNSVKTHTRRGLATLEQLVGPDSNGGAT